MKKSKRNLSLLLALTIGFTPVLTSINRVKSYASEEKETKINFVTAKKLGIKISDIEYSNVSNETVNRILSEMQSRTVGISSETIETKTFTRAELKLLKDVQQAMYDYHVGKLSKSGTEEIITVVAKTAGKATIISLGKKIDIKGLEKSMPFISIVYLFVSTAMNVLEKDYNSVMTKWLQDGRDLLQKALNTGKSNVTLKYVKISWKTSGESIIAGGIILK